MKRREFLKALGIGAAAAVAPVARAHGAKPERPNIVLILVDDMGWTDVGCYGSTYYETPSVDKLCRSGMKFTEGYAPCAVCSPTRASITTGRWPARLGVTDWIHFHDPRAAEAAKAGVNPEGFDPPQNRPLLTPINKFWLEHDEVTLAEVLKPLGYATCHVGKWHLGPRDWFPDRQGFDVNIGGCDYGAPPSYFDPYERNGRGISTMPSRKKGEYLTDREADEAVAFIREHHKKPFFLYMAHYAVHTPIQAKKEMVEKYKRKKTTNQKNPTYAAMVQSVDESVGKILAELDRHDLTHDTIVIFTSDNGGAVHFPATNNAPLRKGKGYPYEGGIREPFIVSWPKQIEAGTVCSTPVTSMDLFPTICEALSAPLPPERVIDGVSLMPLLKQLGGWKGRRLYWHFPHYWWGTRIKPYSIIREGPWKLIRHYEDGRRELYDLDSDLSETKDLAAERPDKVKRMDASLDAWLKRVGAKMPKPNPDYTPPTKKAKK